MKCPCINCERKGCGTYHDICKPYQEYKQEIARTSQNRTKYKEKNAPIGKYKGGQR